LPKEKSIFPVYQKKIDFLAASIFKPKKAGDGG
jgi:hypothetical protein